MQRPLVPSVPHHTDATTINNFNIIHPLTKMFGSITNYFYNRRRGFAKAAGFVGGAYLVGRYVLDRLAEVRERVMQERAARDKYVAVSHVGPVLEMFLQLVSIRARAVEVDIITSLSYALEMQLLP